MYDKSLNPTRISKFTHQIKGLNMNLHYPSVNEIASFINIRYNHLWRRPVNPVLVYQMGKVASLSVYSSLIKANLKNIYHVHRLNPKNIAQVRKQYLERGDIPLNEQMGHYLYKNVIKGNQAPIRVITLVREPISRNISAFFHNLKTFVGGENVYKNIVVDQLMNVFLNLYTHDVPLTWFDIEFHATTGIDIYKYSFPCNDGYQIIKAHPYHILVLKHNLNDEKKESCIAEFLELDTFSLVRNNEASTKQYARAYNKFVKSIKLSNNFVKHMLSSKYAKHFYSLEERSELASRWSRE